MVLLPDPVHSFWVTAGVDYEGKPFKRAMQGAADLALFPRVEPKGESDAETSELLTRFIDGGESDAGGSGLGRARSGPADRERCVPGCARELAASRQLERHPAASRTTRLCSEADPGA